MVKVQETKLKINQDYFPHYHRLSSILTYLSTVSYHSNPYHKNLYILESTRRILKQWHKFFFGVVFKIKIWFHHSRDQKEAKATEIPFFKERKKISGQSYSRWKKTISVRELPTVWWFPANIFEDFGLLNFLGFLVAKSTATTSLFTLALTAVHVQVDKRRHLETKW